MIVDISIDFDYFVRELPKWDLGHREEQVFIGPAWAARYGSIDLHRETNPLVHADAAPHKFDEELNKHGLRFYHTRNVGIAESHKEASPFLLAHSKRVPADMLINFDAHHDCYADYKRPHNPKEHDLSCENWLQLYMDARPTTRVVWVKPKWNTPLNSEGQINRTKLGRSRPSKEGRRIDEVTLLRDLNVQFGTVRNVFLCRSGAWVPPHLDPMFMLLVRLFSRRVKSAKILDRLVIRDSYAMTAAQADERRGFMEKTIAEMAHGIKAATLPPG